MIPSLVRLALRFRKSLILVLGLTTVLSAAYFARNIDKSDNSLPVWFDSQDPDYHTYQNFLKNFGNDRFVIIAFDLGDVFKPDSLSFLKELSRRLNALPQVEEVLSLTEAETIEGDKDILNIHPFIESTPVTAEEAEAFRQKAKLEEDFEGTFFSSDFRLSEIFLRINSANTVKESARLKNDLVKTIDELNGGRYRYYLSGSPIVDEAFNRLAVKDQKILMPASILATILFLLLFFRNFYIALIPTSILFVSLMWILALYYALGRQMNVVVQMVSPILVAVCIADAVHMMLEYYALRQKGVAKDEALLRAPALLWRPCLYTALTTFAGFISFQSSVIPPLNDLGLLTALGVSLVFILTIFFIPLILHGISEPKGEIRLHFNSRFADGFLNRVLHLVKNHRGTVLVVFSSLLLVSFWGISLLKVETNTVDYFFKKEPVRQDLEFFEKNLAGIGGYEMILSGPGEIVKDSRVLQAIDAFKEEALQDGITEKITSVVSSIKKLNQAVNDGDPSFNRIPQKPEEIAQLLLMASSSGQMEMDRYKSSDDSMIRLSARNHWLSIEKMLPYFEGMKRKLKEKFGPLGLKTELTGTGPLWVRLDDDILKSQILSFAIAFTVVSLMMVFFLKSWKVGLISMIPNVIPIFYALGLMGFLGIRLNVATVMIAAVSIGITVDDTIHYLTRFHENLRETCDYNQALEATNRSIGTAILFTSFILIAGFGVLCFGSFMPTASFGGMVALTLFLSVFCEIFLMPIMLLMFKPFKISNNADS